MAERQFTTTDYLVSGVVPLRSSPNGLCNSTTRLYPQKVPAQNVFHAQIKKNKSQRNKPLIWFASSELSRRILWICLHLFYTICIIFRLNVCSLMKIAIIHLQYLMLIHRVGHRANFSFIHAFTYFKPRNWPFPYK